MRSIDAVSISSYSTFNNNIARHTEGALDVQDQSFIGYNNNNQANMDGGAIYFHTSGYKDSTVTIVTLLIF